MRTISIAVVIAMTFGAAFVTAPNANAVSATEKKSFVTSLIVAAQTAQRQYGVPASVSIAQAAVNTNYGTSSLAKSAKNLFSTRCTAKLSASQFAKLAEAQVGKAYVLGAEASISNANPKAFDCSELVQWLYGRSGNPITDLAASQYNATSKVSGSPKPGDLVFLRNNPARSNGIGHVAVVTKKLSNGDWEIIEARGRAYGVVKTTLSYWKKRSYYAGLRRYSKLNFVGDAGVASASAAANYQAGCLSVTSGGKTVKYSKFGSLTDSVLGHAAIVAAGKEYSSARAAMNNVSAFVDAIARAEHSSDAADYAKSVRSVISAYDLTQYDVAPLNLVLSSGSKGTKVTALQYLLNAAGKKVSANGKYDSATVSAVKSVQSSKKLGVDGEAGPITLTALMGTAKQGENSDRVKALKSLLSLAGLPSESGGVFGSQTTASVKTFQAIAGLPITGSADAKTWSRLFMLFDAAPAPVISGKNTVGQVVTAAAGTWSPGKVDVAYQWYRGSSPIPGATGATYRLQAADVNQQVHVTTIGYKATYTSVTRTSNATAPVTPATLSATPTPKISGSAVTGKVLSVIPGTWAPAPVTLTFQWFRNGKAIPGATSSKYQLQAADYQAKIQVAVTGNKYGYYSAAKASGKTASVKQGTFTATPTPKISGKLAVGQTLTVVRGTWSPAPNGFAYQWYRDTKAISGATGSTYKITAADAGHTVKVKVSSTGSGFAKVSKTSAATAKIAKLVWVKAPAPKITGTAKVGKTLTAQIGTWGPTPTKLTITWYRGTTKISGATKSTYKVTKADKGKTITVKVTVSKTGYPTVSKTGKTKIA